MFVLAIIPILSLITLSLWKGIRPAVMISCVLTLVLFLYWGADFNHLLAVVGASILTTTPILLIIFGASFLYNIMESNGLIDEISHSLDHIHPSKDIRFFILAFGLTAFFEGAAGFGTPGAIVPLILIALGFDAILAVSVVVLLDSLFSLFGAVGTPLFTGLQIPLGLSETDTQQIAIIAAVLIVLVGTVLVILVFRMIEKERPPLEHKLKMLLFYVFFTVPFCVFAWFAPELATFLGALVMLVLSVLYITKGKSKVKLLPWVPYGLLALLLLMPKLWQPLKQKLEWKMEFNHILDTEISGDLKLLQSPIIPFLIVGFGVAFIKKSKSLYWKKSLTKVGKVSLVLLPSILISQLMIYSGVNQPSMINYIADMLSKMGASYTFISPFLAATGTFITGSTTISNLIFGASQLETAKTLSLNTQMILALQLAGASLGNGICLFNIIAAAAIADIKNYSDILIKNLYPTLIVISILGIIGTISMAIIV